MSLLPFLFLVNVLTTPPQNCWSLKMICCELQTLLAGLRSQGSRSGLEAERCRAVKTIIDNPSGAHLRAGVL